MKEKDNIELAELLEVYKTEGINPQLDVKVFQEDYKRQEKNKTSVLIQTLIFVGSLLTAGFFLGFLAIAGLFDSGAPMLGMGVFFILISIVVPYVANQSTNIEPFGMALMIVGAILFAAGFTFNSHRFESFLWVSLVLSIFIGIVAGSQLQKFSAIVCFNLCAYWIIWDLRIQIMFNFLILINALIITVGWLKETEVLSAYPKIGQWYSPILNAGSISMLGLLSGSVNTYRDSYWEEAELIGNSYWWVAALLLIALVLWALNETLELVGELSKRIPILIGTGIALLLLTQAPGIVGGILLLFLGVYSGYKLFVAQGILAIFFFTVLFYYNLNTSLLVKSILMLGAGILFLAIGAAIKRVFDYELSKN